jgi:hypothetical protein
VLIKGQLVKHKKSQEVGLVLEKSKNHNDFYVVMNRGAFEEWHISNISH